MPSKTTETPMLDSMITIMEAVAKENLPFDMTSFYADKPKSIPSDIHNCGTAACIVGYCATDAEFLSKFLPSFTVEDSTLLNICPKVCCALDEEIGIAFAESIYEYPSTARSEALCEVDPSCNADNIHSLLNHAHVCYDTNCPITALDYMKRVREHVQANGKFKDTILY